MASLYEVLEKMRDEIASAVIKELAASEEYEEVFLRALGERIAETIVKQNDLTK